MPVVFQFALSLKLLNHPFPNGLWGTLVLSAQHPAVFWLWQTTFDGDLFFFPCQQCPFTNPASLAQLDWPPNKQ